MNGETAQLVALTCHANAYLPGQQASLPLSHSTCQFCTRVSFARGAPQLRAMRREPVVAGDPDSWFALLLHEGATTVRLCYWPSQPREVAERLLTAFANSGGQWALQALLPAQRSELWIGQWEVVDPDAPDRRIWRVSYQSVSDSPPVPHDVADVPAAAERMFLALRDIHAFADTEGIGNFAHCFERAAEALAGWGPAGYHQDLAPQGVLSDEARALLEACQSARVFGGMGSWNDLTFDGPASEEYDRVSEQLYRALIDGIRAAANSTIPAQ